MVLTCYCRTHALKTDYLLFTWTTLTKQYFFELSHLTFQIGQVLRVSPLPLGTVQLICDSLIILLVDVVVSKVTLVTLSVFRKLLNVVAHLVVKLFSAFLLLLVGFFFCCFFLYFISARFFD